MAKGIIVKPSKPRLGISVTPSIIDLICNGVENALQFEQAAMLAGLSIWQAKKLKRDATDLITGAERAKEFDEAYASLLSYFAENIVKAQAKGEQYLLKIMREAAPQDWKAANRLLEIMRPERYGKRSVIVTSDPLPASNANNINFEELPDSKLQEFIDGEFVSEEELEQSDNTEEEIK